MPIQRPIHQSRGAAAMLLLALFALPFLGIGLGTGYLALSTVYSSMTMAGWPTVPGVLERVELHAPGNTEKVKATYRYSVGGVEYRGDKASLYTADNIGSFHKEAFARLNEAFSKGGHFPVHVNPHDATESILLTTLRWEVLSFYFLFFSAFGGVGGGLLLAAIYQMRDERVEKKLARQYPNEPWRHREKWTSGRIYSEGKLGAYGLTTFAVLWSLTTFPMLVGLPEKISNGEGKALLFIILPGFGVFLLYRAAISLGRLRRSGKTYLELEPFPPRPGTSIKGRMHAPASLEGMSQVKFVLTCKRFYRTTNGSKRSTAQEIVSTQEFLAPVLRGQTASGDLLVKVDLPLSPSAATSARNDSQWFRWELTASAELAGADFSAEFEIPVFK